MTNGKPLYEELLQELKENAEPEYAAFHKRLLKNDKINVMGVRVPILRKIAKKYKNYVPTLLSFPDEYYEVTFVKLQAAALLPYNFFINYVDKCVSLIDNWATCDCFAPKCIADNKDDFWKYINNFMLTGGEFAQRFALTTLLHFYVEEDWLDAIYASVLEYVDVDLYYVHMAAAWLLAEVLVKYYDQGVKYLKFNELDIKTHNKAIQKACESYRLTKEQKDFLRGLKR
ncbi:MAG: DNA alkylation repair protein [Clostridia bacterium]|nr:DNA alkylation repair protein [Clostridia bacterium]